MQDRFKFKVLDTNTNKLYSDMDSLSKEEPNAHFLLAQDGEIVNKYYNNGEIQLIRMSQYKPVFCTGLKDKNGKLIYNGDIVKIDDEIFVIIYWRGEFTAESIDNAIPQEERVHMNWYNFCYPNNLPILPEVIGNIYENPELLEDK